MIGVLADSVDHIVTAYDTMRGQDPKDHSSVAVPTVAGRYEHRRSDEVETIGVLGGDLGLDAGVERNFRATVAALEDRGYTTKPIELSTLEYVVPAYYTIAAAEASANLARYNGVRYGYRPLFSENPEELMRRARTEAFGDEVKLRVVLGTYVLRSGFQDRYYTRAQKIRTLIRNELDACFDTVDAIFLPTFPTQAFPHGDAGMGPVPAESCRPVYLHRKPRGDTGVNGSHRYGKRASRRDATDGAGVSGGPLIRDSAIVGNGDTATIPYRFAIVLRMGIENSRMTAEEVDLPCFSHLSA